MFWKGSETSFERIYQCLTPVAGVKFCAAKDWLVDRRKAIGRTALCLSGGGSLAMHHMGVCRFLLEDVPFFEKKSAKNIHVWYIYLHLWLKILSKCR